MRRHSWGPRTKADGPHAIVKFMIREGVVFGSPWGAPYNLLPMALEPLMIRMSGIPRWTERHSEASALRRSRRSSSFLAGRPPCSCGKPSKLPPDPDFARFNLVPRRHHRRMPLCGTDSSFNDVRRQLERQFRNSTPIVLKHVARTTHLGEEYPHCSDDPRAPA